MKPNFEQTAQFVQQVLNETPPGGVAKINNAMPDGQKSVLEIGKKHGLSTPEMCVFLQFLATSYCNAAVAQVPAAEDGQQKN